MKIKIPESLKGKELLTYLHENKEQLKAYKKTGIKNAPTVGYSSASNIQVKEGACKGIKAETQESVETGVLRVDVIANLAGWMDFDDDVLLPGAYNKTISDKKNNRPFLKDHRYSTDAIIGDTVDVFKQDFSISAELGLQNESDFATTEGVVFRADIRKSYDAGMFEKYKNGAIKEHSIGLRYVKIDLAINDPDFEDEYRVWKGAIGRVINRSKAEKNGYFWAVREIEIIENSAVVFGSNSITPVLSASEEGKQVSSNEDNSDKSAVSNHTDEGDNNSEEVGNSTTSDFIGFFKQL